jgi:hypothetical protein
MSVSGSKYKDLDNKISDVELKLFENIEKMENKFNSLKEQMIKFTKIYEEEKANKLIHRNKNLEELKIFETKIKNLLNEERSFIHTYTENAFHKVEERLKNLENKKEIEEINSSINQLKETVEVSLKLTIRMS